MFRKAWIWSFVALFILMIGSALSSSNVAPFGLKSIIAVFFGAAIPAALLAGLVTLYMYGARPRGKRP